jgi:hypothetical protein
VAVAAELGRGFASNGRENEASIMNLKTLQTPKTVPGSRTMTLDPKTHKIYLAAVKFGPPAQG